MKLNHVSKNQLILIFNLYECLLLLKYLYINPNILSSIFSKFRNLNQYSKIIYQNLNPKFYLSKKVCLINIFLVCILNYNLFMRLIKILKSKFRLHKY